MKLPCFYLLDAIAKNVFDVYASVFSRIVVSLFVDTYFQVDSNTRVKMEEMLLTWRTAGPDYTELFGPDSQLQLQTAVWGDQVCINVFVPLIIIETFF
jgi:pre-mRNA cleavage complex 2 protein Pcf11